jgi:hypothetical protein
MHVVTKTRAAVSIVTRWNEPVPGRDLAPLKPTVFSRCTRSGFLSAQRELPPGLQQQCH